MIERFKKLISPLLILFLLIVLNSAWWFSKDSGPEGWGHFYAFLILLSSIPVVIVDIIIRRLVKSEKQFIVLELFFTLILAFVLFKIKFIGNL